MSRIWTPTGRFKDFFRDGPQIVFARRSGAVQPEVRIGYSPAGAFPGIYGLEAVSFLVAETAPTSGQKNRNLWGAGSGV